jgi:hypothetical protein
MADCGAFRPLWSEAVEEEALRALCEIHPDIDPSRFYSRFRSMNEAFEDARVSGWEPLVEGLELPDPNDRHVLAAAIRGRADVIVTENVRDFPTTALAPLGMEAVRLDDFLLSQFDLSVTVTVQLIEDQARAMGRPRSRKTNCWNGWRAAGHLDSPMRSRPCWLPRELRRGTSKNPVCS